MKFYPSRQNLISALVILCFFLSLVQGSNEAECNRFLTQWRNNLQPGDLVRYVGFTPYEIRKDWGKRAKLDVYSKSKGKWWEGEVKEIKNDAGGEWLNVEYQVDGELGKKDIKRGSPNIRQSTVRIKSAPDMTTQKVSIYYTEDGNSYNINLKDIYPEGLHPNDTHNEIMLSKWKSFRSKNTKITKVKALPVTVLESRKKARPSEVKTLTDVAIFTDLDSKVQHELPKQVTLGTEKYWVVDICRSYQKTEWEVRFSSKPRKNAKRVFKQISQEIKEEKARRKQQAKAMSKIIAKYFPGSDQSDALESLKEKYVVPEDDFSAMFLKIMTNDSLEKAFKDSTLRELAQRFKKDVEKDAQKRAVEITNRLNLQHIIVIKELTTKKEKKACAALLHIRDKTADRKLIIKALEARFAENEEDCRSRRLLERLSGSDL